MNIAAILYNGFVIPLLYLAFRLLGQFNEKIKRGIQGRALLFPRLEEQLNALPPAKLTFLIHAASMGEYEQVRPIIRQMRGQWPAARIVLSLFSPSVYENVHTNHSADIVTYLPFDSRPVMRRFLRMINPDALLIARHDIWPNLVWQAKKHKIYTLLIDASVHEGSFRHKPVIHLFNRAIFSGLDVICPISQSASVSIEKFLNTSHRVEVCGDTRFDQVVSRAKEKPVEDILPQIFLRNKHIFVAGSTWPEDEAVIVNAFARAKAEIGGLHLILVPHEPNEAHLLMAESRCDELGLSYVRLSKFSQVVASPNVLLVDRMGILANIYAAGQAAFVGGSFGPGVHSVIEAAAHRVPVLFGPKMRNSAEAIDLVDEQAGFVISDVQTAAEKLIDWFSNPNTLQNLSEKAHQFVTRRTGASQKIISILMEKFTSSHIKRTPVSNPSANL